MKTHNSKLQWICIALVLILSPSTSLADEQNLEKESIVDQKIYTDLQNSQDGNIYVIVRLQKPMLAADANITQKRWAIKKTQTSVRNTLTPDEFTIVHQYDNICSITGFVGEKGLAKLASNPLVSAIGADVGGYGHLDVSVPFINADDVHSDVGVGFTGEGITVAILDSGIDSDHPDLKDDIASGWYHFLSTGSGAGAEDDHGHGTNVSGIITSKGVVAPLGVAPDANILAVKVLDSQNAFQRMSDVTAGVDYVVTHKNDYGNLCVMNMSLGSNELFTQCPCDSKGDESGYAWLGDLRDSLQAAKDVGILTFVSSGNNGSCTSMPAPACLSSVTPVAAVYDQDLGREPNSGTYYSNYGGSWPACYNDPTYGDLIACFSNRNSCNELAAPGRNIKSCGKGGGTSEFTGTSQASPHCAGVAALMCEKADCLMVSATPDFIVNTMKNTGIPTTDLLCSTSPIPIRVDAFKAVNKFIVESTGYKYKQKPNTSGYGMDIRFDRLGNVSRVLADDFVCNVRGPVKKIVLFASHIDDFLQYADNIYLRIYDDIPDPDGGGPQFSKPGNLLWQAEVDRQLGEFTETLFYEIPPMTIPAKAWWWDPAGSQDPISLNDKKTMRIDIQLPPSNYFVQKGSPCEPKIYWLAVYASFKWTLWPMPAIGWKTAATSQNDAAVWSNDNGSTWNRLTYPAAHPNAGLPIDFSFRLFGSVCCKSVDYDSNNSVDFEDFQSFADDWFWVTSGNENHSDLNCDYVVNFTDLAIYCSQWLNNCFFTCPPD